MYENGSALIAASILCITLVIFTLGKSPVFRVDRAGASLIGAISLVSLGVLSFEEAVALVDYKTIVILFSMMVVVANLKIAGFFELLGNTVLQSVSSQKQLLLAVIAASGAMSALAINDVICLLFTPVVIFICRKTSSPPLPYLLGVATASNIGSAASLIGNPQNILIGSLSGLSFSSYLFTAGPVACIGLILNYLILAFLYRRELQGVLMGRAQESVHYHTYLAFKSIAVLGLVIASYISGYDLALASSLGAALLLMTRRVKPNKIYTGIDFNLLLIFIGLFIIVGGVEKSGLVQVVVRFLPQASLGSLEVFAVITMVLSNIVSNVPAVLLLKFFIPEAHAQLWWKGLALFSTLAGNLTLTGSIANLIVVEVARKQGVSISAHEYLKVGLPLTLVLTLLGVVWLNVTSAIL